MKSVLFIITDYGSFNNFLGDLAVRLVKNDIEVSVICSGEKVIAIDDKYDYIKLGIDFFNVDFPRSFNFKKHFKVSTQIHNIIELIQPSIISVHFTTAIFTTLLKGKPKVKTIGMYHGVGYPMIESFVKKNIFKAVELYTMKLLDEIWVLNDFDKLLIEGKFPKKTYLLPTKGLGCNLEMFNKDNFSIWDKLNLRKELNIEERDFVIVFTGRYVDFKGYGIFVQSFIELKEKHGISNLKLITLGGRDTIHPTGLSEKEENYLNSSGDVIDIGFTKEVSKYLSIANLFVFPSKKEGVPVCIIEALSMCVPVVTYNARGCNDLVIDNHNGKLLSLDKDKSDFSKIIKKLIESPDELERLKINIEAERFLYSRENFVNHQLEYFSNSK